MFEDQIKRKAKGGAGLVTSATPLASSFDIMHSFLVTRYVTVLPP
jgi:hypothetical protein